MQQISPSGTCIAGRYEVAGRPLMGGMGIVYLCFDHQEQRPVALKTFRPEFLPDRAARERFLEEGNTWVRLGNHPHIVRAYSVERIGDGREVYLVLELVAKEEGRRDASLRSWLTPGKPLPVDQALLIALQIVRGMRHATETIPGFVHRDLKPENILVGADRLSNAAINRVRVTDFGLVKGLRAEQAPAAGTPDLTTAPTRLTRVGALLGTPAYMAPEQWEGADVSVQADIYALGCILGEMLTGRMLVQGGTLDALRRTHQGGQAWAAERAALSPALRAWLQRCLAFVPGARYGSWQVLEEALRDVYAASAGRALPVAEPVSVLRQEERVAMGWSYSALGLSYLDIGKAQQAVGYFERAVAVGRGEGQRGLEGAVLGNLGSAYAALGDARQAIGYFEQALVIVREIGDRRGKGAALGNLGRAYPRLGDARRAIGYCEEQLAVVREIGDRGGEGNALSNLGVAYRQLGDARRAIGYYEEQLVIVREIGERGGEGNTLGNLGNAYLQLGDVRRAIDYYEQALATRREIGDRAGEGTDLGNLGIAYADLGDVQQAISCYEQSLAIGREIGDSDGMASTSFNMALLYTQQGDYANALPLAREAVRLVTQMGHSAKVKQVQQFVAWLEGQGR